MISRADLRSMLLPSKRHASLGERPLLASKWAARWSRPLAKLAAPHRNHANKKAAGLPRDARKGVSLPPSVYSVYVRPNEQSAP